MLNQVWASMFYIIFHVVLNVYELFGVYYGEQLVPFMQITKIENY